MKKTNRYWVVLGEQTLEEALVGVTYLELYTSKKKVKKLLTSCKKEFKESGRCIQITFEDMKK
jgi:hypothetical protein